MVTLSVQSDRFAGETFAYFKETVCVDGQYKMKQKTASKATQRNMPYLTCSTETAAEICVSVDMTVYLDNSQGIFFQVLLEYECQNRAALRCMVTF